jgi:murein DD-endopeptidase MepM/ murein hydrolase activator NlpD
MYTCYGHLSSFKVSVGDYVSRGDLIVLSGSTGVSTGPHLHFEVRVGGSSSGCRVDPLNYLPSI